MGQTRNSYLKYGVDVYPESPVVALDAEQKKGTIAKSGWKSNTISAD